MSAKSNVQISCLTVTQAHRFNFLKNALDDFQAQRDVDSELVLVHDSGSDFHTQILEYLGMHSFNRVRCFQVAPGLTLGELRNINVEAAQGEFICQWDDDDRYHPDRLRLQLQALQQNSAEACFLQDQLHYFSHSRRLFWTEWQRDPFPLDVVPGTLLIKRSCMPEYPPLRRGEDTYLCHQLLKNGVLAQRVAGLGWTYVYQFHGKNTWSEAHHMAIAIDKSMNSARLVGKYGFLKNALSEFQPLIVDRPLSFKHRDNFFEFR